MHSERSSGTGGARSATSALKVMIDTVCSVAPTASPAILKRRWRRNSFGACGLSLPRPAEVDMQSLARGDLNSTTLAVVRIPP